jgi:hypothetical protein
MLLSLKKLKEDFKLNITGVIHIGAHHGQEFKYYIENNIENMLFFEPLKKNYNVLLNNIQLSEKVKAYNMALGNIEGEIGMYVESANQGQSSSILEPKLHISQYPHIVFNDREVVQINKLDNIQFEKSNFNMINIDVQGYELEAFKGAIETLNSIDIIYTEVNRDEVYLNCAKVYELDDFLDQYNFKRVITTWDGKTWGDALYLKMKT